ncbi:MAG: hypothetical protein HZB41_05855 [Ignavibacteriae bacterium]|nr:hypothetical protein [Ignavibacteriota bacterium]
MNIPILYEKIHEHDFPGGYYYAHIPTLNLTTHGLGIEGAKSAAGDLIKLWLDEKASNNEPISLTEEYLFSTIEM